MSRYTNITVFAVKKEPLNENTVLKSLNGQGLNVHYLSSEGFCMKFGRFFAEILKSEYQEISPWSPY